jgi:hypothetical protein
MADWSKTKDSFDLTQLVVMLIGVCLFIAIEDDNTAINVSVSWLHPPYGVKASGVKVTCSMFSLFLIA